MRREDSEADVMPCAAKRQPSSAPHSRQFRSDERLHLAPNFRIAFDLDVLFPEQAGVLRIPFALDGARSIIGPEISQNPRVRRVRCADFAPAMQHAARLIEIGGHVNLQRKFYWPPSNAANLGAIEIDLGQHIDDVRFEIPVHGAEK